VRNVNYHPYKKLRTLKKITYSLLLLLHINLKFKRKISNIFMKNMRVVAPWTLLPGVAAVLPVDDSYYTSSHFLQSRQPNVRKVP
jgi:hypothetical protein